MSDKDAKANADETTWLPNLVGGVSIWKLAPDLNEEKFFGGRLLVPETEGSESLPTTVRWNLSGLVPLSEARSAHGADATAAVEEFRACLERVAKTFADEDSGYHRYRDALTVPSLEAGTTDNYFYSPTDKRLYVINWGATPRTLAGQKEFLFGYAEFGKVFGAGALAAGAALAVGAAKASAPPRPLPRRPPTPTPRRRTTRPRRRRIRAVARCGSGFCSARASSRSCSRCSPSSSRATTPSRGSTPAPTRRARRAPTP